MSNQLPTQYQQFIHLSRYSRWLPEEGRRETWNETVGRYFNFFEEHLDEMHNFKLDDKTRTELEEGVLDTSIMPSMRCLMTAGEALRRENIAGYNCSYVAVDRVAAFDEILYVLMNGTGVGFSVERQFTTKLPVVAEEFYHSDTMITVADSKLGWAKALKELIGMLYIGQIPKWDLSKVRPAGARLKTFGGRASGAEPLENLFKFTVGLFKKAKGRKLNSLECHDLMCKIGEVTNTVRHNSKPIGTQIQCSEICKITNGMRYVDNTTATYIQCCEIIYPICIQFSKFSQHPNFDIVTVFTIKYFFSQFILI